MRTTMVMAVIVLAAGAAGCGKSRSPGGGGSRVDIQGASPEDAADEVATAICEWSARCGEVSIECSGTSTGEIDCTGTIEDVSFSSCYDETQPDVLSDFQCAELTDAEQQQVNDCINGMISQGCVTMAQLDAYVEAVERDEDPDYPLEIPPACELLEEVFRGCP